MIGEGSSDICKGEFGGVLGSVSPDWRLMQMLGVDPNDGGCCHAEVQMIGDCVGVAGLGVSAADLLFDLSETGLDFPPGGIIFDDLLDAEIEIRGHQRDPLGLAIDPHDAHTATQGLEHHDPLGGFHLAQGAVDMPV